MDTLKISMKRSGPLSRGITRPLSPGAPRTRLSRRGKPVQPELAAYLRGRSRTELVDKILVEDGVTHLPDLPLIERLYRPLVSADS